MALEGPGLATPDLGGLKSPCPSTDCYRYIFAAMVQRLSRGSPPAHDCWPMLNRSDIKAALSSNTGHIAVGIEAASVTSLEARMKMALI